MPVEDAKARRERIRNSMRQFYNLPKDDVNNTGSPTSASSAPNARVDAFRRANLKTAAPASAALDMDSPSFDASTYAADLLQNASIRGLYERDTSLNREIRALDGSLQELVYKNYSKFIHATDTIRQMRDNVADIDTKLDALSHNVNSIAGVSKTISGNLESHRSKIEEMLTRNQMLHKIKFLIELPATLKTAIKEGRYADAVRDWQAGDLVFTRHAKVASFQRTHDECRTVALQLFKQLEVTVKKGALFTNPEEMIESSTAIKDGAAVSRTSSASSAAATSKKKADVILPLPIIPTTNIHSSNPYGAGDASIVIRQALSDLTVLVNTSIFTDSNRPKSFSTKIVNTLYDSVEDALKAKLNRITNSISREWCVPFLTSGISPDVWPSGSDCKFGGSDSSAPGSSTSNAPGSVATITNGAVLIYEHITTPFTNSPAALETHFEEVKKAFAKAVSDIEIIEECEQEENHHRGNNNTKQHHSDPNTGGGNAEEVAATQKHRITAACQPALVNFMDTLFPLTAKVGAAYLKALVHHQSNVMDSQRSAAEAAIAVKRSCEGCVQTLHKILTQFVELLKRTGIKYLQSPRGFASLVDDCTGLVFEHVGNALRSYVNFCPITCTVYKPVGGPHIGTASSSPNAAAPSNGDATFVHAHSVLVAAMQLSLIVERNFGGLVRSNAGSTAASSGSKDTLKILTHDYKINTNLLISHFIRLAGNHFGDMLRENYILSRLRSPRTPQDSPSGPHNDIAIMFAQWAALHAAARHWFGTSGDDSSVDLQSASSGNFHNRTDSDAASSLRLTSSVKFGAAQQLPTVAAIPGDPAGLMKVRTKGLNFLDVIIGGGAESVNTSVHSAEGAGGGGSENTYQIWDALKIQDSVICFSLIGLLETLRGIQVCGLKTEGSSGSMPFPLHFVQQLQIDLSFLLQQINPNIVFWVLEEVRLVVIFNEIMGAAVNGCGNSRESFLGNAMVEKLAKSDM